MQSLLVLTEAWEEAQAWAGAEAETSVATASPLPRDSREEEEEEATDQTKSGEAPRFVLPLLDTFS